MTLTDTIGLEQPKSLGDLMLVVVAVLELHRHCV